MTDVFAPQSSDDITKFIKAFDDDGTAIFEQPAFQNLDFSAIFGQRTTSNTQNAIEYGVKGFTLDYDNDSIQVGYPLQCRSLDDPQCFMQGVVVLKDLTYSPAYIEVAITVISPLVNTTNNWELSVIPLAGFSINPSATVGISTTSIDASGDGPFTFTTQTGKLFMQTEAIGGTVVCNALNDPKTYLYGRIAASNGTSLVIEKIYSNATTSIASWSIQLFDGPPQADPLLLISGLLVTPTGADPVLSVDVAAGSVVDSTGTLRLVLDNPITKSLTSVFATGDGNGGILRTAFLAGTISSSGTSVTGTGTAFLTDFANPTSNDFLNSGGDTATLDEDESIISLSGDGRRVTDVTNNTSLAAASGLGASASQYRRGGFASEASRNQFVIALMRRDSDGLIDVGASALTPSGEPDLPSGFTYYRVLAVIATGGAGQDMTVRQPLYDHRSPFALKEHSFYTWENPDESALLPNAQTLVGSASVAFSVVSTTTTVVRAALTGDVTAASNSNATTLSSTAITNKTEKTALVDDDLFLIADSEASFALKKVKNVNAGGGGGGASFPADMGLITEAATISFDAGTVP